MTLVHGWFRRLRKLPAPDKLQKILSDLIKLSLLAAFAFSLSTGDWTSAFVSIGALIATLLPSYLAHSFQFRLPAGFEFVLVSFVFATLFLGEVHGFYTKFWWWDAVLHAGSAVAFGFIGFLILFSLHKDGRFEAAPSLIAFLSFSVAMAIGALWEIFEYGMDVFFGLNMQKSGLDDTMGDLIVDAFGALVAATSGYFYLHKNRGIGIFHYYLKSYFGRKPLRRWRRKAELESSET